MKKQSIEEIWRQGFLKQEQLTAPKINNLYNQKSMHIIDQFKKQFKWNIIGIIIAGIVIFTISLFIGAGIAGFIILGLLLVIAWASRQDQESLDRLDKGQNSYVYLKEFKAWIDNLIEKYGSLYRYVYPVMTLTLYFGLWFSDVAAYLREKVVDAGQELIWGVHPLTTIFIIAISLIMSVFSKRIHREDVSLLYGGIMKKLDELIAEMEELQGNSLS